LGLEIGGLSAAGLSARGRRGREVDQDSAPSSQSAVEPKMRRRVMHGFVSIIGLRQRGTSPRFP
jgi:hypothetical protein